MNAPNDDFGSDLRDIIVREKILSPPHYKVPSAEELNELGYIVWTLALRCRNGQLARWSAEEIERDQRLRRARNALRQLADVLPAIRNDVVDDSSRVSMKLVGKPNIDISSLILSEDLGRLDRLHQVVLEATSYEFLRTQQEHAISTNLGFGGWSVPPPSQDREIHSWHHFAAFLADQFRDVVQAANPTRERLKVGNGNNPVVKFLVAIIPRITNERPTDRSVREHLRKAQKLRESDSGISQGAK